MTPDTRRNIFISYSHEDSKWLEKLQLYLAPLKQGGKLQAWSDHHIRAGALWKAEIGEAIAAAKVAILLVSPHFFASDFIAKQELPFLLTAAEQGNAQEKKRIEILWIAVSASGYKHTDIGQYEALNNPERPLDELSPIELNHELNKIADKIAEAMNPKLQPTPDITPERLHQLRTPPCQPDRVHLIHAAQGAIGGLIAGIYLAVRYYFWSRNLPGYEGFPLSWWLLTSILEIVFSCVIGTLIGASVLYFMSRFRALYKKTGFWANVRLNVLAASIGGGSPAVVAGILAAITFGERGDAPQASPEDILIGVGIGTLFICAGVLQSEGNTFRSALASSAVAVVLVFCVLIFLFNTFATSEFLQNYFVSDKVYMMVVTGILVGVAAGLLVGIQIELSRQTHRYLMGLSQGSA